MLFRISNPKLTLKKKYKFHVDVEVKKVKEKKV